MDESDCLEVRWIRTGIVGGVWACLAYPVMLFAPLPLGLLAALAGSFGPALALGCAGLWRLLRLHRPTVAASAAAGLNAIGGSLFTSMVLVQMAAGVCGRSPVQAVWLGLDVAWDGYIGVGTALFGFSMLRHPRFGRVFGGTGIAIGLALLCLNFYTFPTPPANAGLVDLGPVVGLWYLAVTVQMWRSLSWAQAAASVGRT